MTKEKKIEFIASIGAFFIGQWGGHMFFKNARAAAADEKTCEVVSEFLKYLGVK